MAPVHFKLANMIVKVTYVVFWTIIAFNLLNSDADKIWVNRNKRYLPFPMGAGNKLQVITGFGIPVDLKDNDVTFGLIMKTNFELPTNSAQFTRPEEAFGTEGNKMNRWTFYEIIKDALNRLSLDGQSCLLKSICQAAFTAFEHNGLLGEILQILFLPSTTLKESENEINEYIKAEMIGRETSEDKSCHDIFQNCSLSLMEIITTLESQVLEKLILKNI